MYAKLLQQISISPDAELSNPAYTPAAPAYKPKAYAPAPYKADGYAEGKEEYEVMFISNLLAATFLPNTLV